MRRVGLLLLLSTAALADEATLRIVSSPEGAAVSIDGALVGLSPREERLAPGVHTVTVERAGVVATQTLSLAAGERRTVQLELAGLLTPPRRFPLVGTATFAGGALAFAAGLLLQQPAREAAAQVSRLFERGGGWDARARELEARGLAAQAWSNLLTWAGVGLLASGVVAGLLELNGHAAPRLVVVPGAEGLFAAWSTRW